MIIITLLLFIALLTFGLIQFLIERRINLLLILSIIFILLFSFSTYIYAKNIQKKYELVNSKYKDILKQTWNADNFTFYNDKVIPINNEIRELKKEYNSSLYSKLFLTKNILKLKELKLKDNYLNYTKNFDK